MNGPLASVRPPIGFAVLSDALRGIMVAAFSGLPASVTLPLPVLLTLPLILLLTLLFTVFGDCAAAMVSNRGDNVTRSGCNEGSAVCMDARMNLVKVLFVRLFAGYCVL